MKEQKGWQCGALLVPFFLIWATNLAAFTFSQEEVLKKCQQKLPAWMESQIVNDLEPFQEKGFTVQDIEKTIQEVNAIPSGSMACFARFQIRENRISITSFEQPDDARIVHVKEVLEDMLKFLSLPDVDFIISIWDSYDNPIFLEHTYCPIFAISKLKTNRFGVLFPEFRNFSYRQRLINDISWTSDHSSWVQKISKAHWRGMTSGWNYTLDAWDMKPRSRLVLFSKENPHLLDAAFTSSYSLDPTIKMWMLRYELFQPWVYPVEFIKFKYLISIDGNTFASNFWWQLLSNCAVLKSESEYLEWFYQGIAPYEHYIPFALDTSDLEEKIVWCINHDAEIKKIAEEGHRFAKEHLSNEALVFYFYKLLLAYAKLLK